MASEPSLAGQTVVITAGPTREAIDPVRFLSNRSSGRMGFALARAFDNAGARVLLVAGPVTLPTPDGVTRIDVESARQMEAAVNNVIDGADIFVGCAAVSDYRPAATSSEKIKKTADELTLKLVRGPDILAGVAARENRPFTVGFAAETENLIENARAKMNNKSLDMIAANLVGVGRGFEQDDNELTVLWEGGEEPLGKATKMVLAEQLVILVGERFSAHAQRERA